MGGESDLYSLLMTISRAHEFEADQFGALYAYRAGFNPAESVTLHEKMLQAMGEIPRGMTHPTHAERIARVRDYLLDLRAKVRGFDLAVKALNGGDYDAARAARGVPRRVPRFAVGALEPRRRAASQSAVGARAVDALSPRHRRRSQLARAQDRAARRRRPSVGRAEASTEDRRAHAAKRRWANIRRRCRSIRTTSYAQVNLGAALDDLKDRKGARVALEKAVRMAPQSKEAWNNLGAVAAEMGDTGARARGAAESGRARRRYADAWFNLGHDLRAGRASEGRRRGVGQVCHARRQEWLDRDREQHRGRLQ